MDVPVTVAVLEPMCTVRSGRVALQGTSLRVSEISLDLVKTGQGMIENQSRLGFQKTYHNVSLFGKPVSRTAPGTRL